ncbi:MAG: penicillin acylase family protein [Pseudomonadales bacterium]|nr:penicillin acylase family protein [Halioglobus sp.]MCP5194993.1 penicillin acylase family protein [Pseudomonadales bacterium]
MPAKFTDNRTTAVRAGLALGLALCFLVTGCSDNSNGRKSQPEGPEVPTPVDRAFYVLPPGNFGGLPTSDNSYDQLSLYDGLTPLRGDVTDADIEQHFIAENLAPVGETTEEATGRPGTTILYDQFGVPHITGETRADMAFGAGWVTARDRALLVGLARGPARAAVADVPGIDAFDLVLSGQSFVPSAATEQLVSDQVELIIDTYGDEGREIIADAQAYADGWNAYQEANGGSSAPLEVNDVVAITAFIGSIFGAGGGSEAANAEFLSTLIYGLGDGRGQLAWEDAMLFDDPEAPTTINTRFEYGPLTGGAVTGSAVIDRDSIISLDPRDPAFVSAYAPEAQPGVIPAAGPPIDRQASNFLIVNAPQSVNGTNLAVMGPQLGFYYPEIVQQMHLSAPGIEAQGVAVPGISMYLLIGRTENYAWSLTSANHDVRDVFAEVLCNPDGTDPSRESSHYEFKGECRPFEIFDAGTLNGVPIRYPVSVHGPVIGTATSNGQPIALTRRRSTFGRDGLNLAGLKDMTEGDAATPENFWESANKFGFTFNWGYISRSKISYFSSGYLPVRAPGLDRRLPTWGNGDYEWQGFLELAEHPHAVDGPSGRLLNWNNQSAPGFMHGDGTPYGSVHRVELFDRFPEQVGLAGVVSVMNRSATEDTRSPAWPVVSEVLHGGDAPSALAADVVELLDEWVADDAPRLDADDDGFNDHAGPTIMDALWPRLAEAVMRPVFGDLTAALDKIRDLGGSPEATSGSSPEGASYVDKDLRTLLGRDVKGKFNLSYCGNGDLDECRASLWLVVEEVSQQLAAERGDDPATWLKQGARLTFAPGLIPETFRATNRPTFQQVLEFVPRANAGQ